MVAELPWILQRLVPELSGVQNPVGCGEVSSDSRHLLAELGGVNRSCRAECTLERAFENND